MKISAKTNINQAQEKRAARVTRGTNLPMEVLLSIGLDKVCAEFEEQGSVAVMKPSRRKRKPARS